MLGRMYFLERFLLQKHHEMSTKEATDRAIHALATAVELGGNPQTRLLLQQIGIYDKYATFDTISWLQIYEDGKKKSDVAASGAAAITTQYCPYSPPISRREADGLPASTRKMAEKISGFTRGEPPRAPRKRNGNNSRRFAQILFVVIVNPGWQRSKSASTIILSMAWPIRALVKLIIMTPLTAKSLAIPSKSRISLALSPWYIIIYIASEKHDNAGRNRWMN